METTQTLHSARKEIKQQPLLYFVVSFIFCYTDQEWRPDSSGNPVGMGTLQERGPCRNGDPVGMGIMFINSDFFLSIQGLFSRVSFENIV